jgi:predicted acyl esterase
MPNLATTHELMMKSGGAMVLEKDIDVPMRDGVQLKANLYRPQRSGPYPVLLSLGPYGKDVHLSEFMPGAWVELQKRCPEILDHSTCKHLVFETADPEVWVKDAYIVLKVDSRGSGKSAGFLDVNSPAEFKDLFDVIEWAGVQAWSNGHVGLLGISYYAAGQWMMASLRPPHLSAILPWQGGSDFYRDRSRQGGIFGSGFAVRWWNRSVLRNQFGNPECPFKDIVTQERNTGPASLTPTQLAENRVDYIGNILSHPLDGPFYRERSPIFENIDVPALVVANYGGLGLHLRGTIEGFNQIASKNKWLKVQAGSYFLTFLQPQNVALQKRFFDHYLKGIQNDWPAEPRVEVAVRSITDTVTREIRAQNWPLEGTRWSMLYLNAADLSLSKKPSIDSNFQEYDTMGEGLCFTLPPLAQDMELAGPATAKLFVASQTQDMDLFLTLRAFNQDQQEVTFFGATEPKSPVSMGWLRVSQRKIDPAKTLPHRPFHAHDESQLLKPGKIYEVDVEIWPLSLSLPKGCTLVLQVQGRDFERMNETSEQRGSGWFLHNHEADRPADVFATHCRLYTGKDWPSFVMLPMTHAS